ncbi:MAG: VIT1/CCC1 family protein [Chloroflexota bacterium]
MELSPDLRRKILGFQQTEITEHHIYQRLAEFVPEKENQDLLRRIAADEMAHYQAWRSVSQQDVHPRRATVLFYYWISRILGFTFGLKLMERREGQAQEGYGQVVGQVAIAERLLKEEVEHEETLLKLLDEERLRYAGSIVLGLNDALVELTGALAGLTLALQNTKLIAITGLITGVAAALCGRPCTRARPTSSPS